MKLNIKKLLPLLIFSVSLAAHLPLASGDQINNSPYCVITRNELTPQQASKLNNLSYANIASYSYPQYTVAKDQTLQPVELQLSTRTFDETDSFVSLKKGQTLVVHLSTTLIEGLEIGIVDESLIINSFSSWPYNTIKPYTSQISKTEDGLDCSIIAGDIDCGMILELRPFSHLFGMYANINIGYHYIYLTIN
jgi:hypothetical protein